MPDGHPHCQRSWSIEFHSLSQRCFKMTIPQVLFQSSFTPYDVLEANSLSFLKKILFIYFNWRLITLQYCGGFCHTLTRISHGCTCVPHPEPPSHIPPHPIPLGRPSAPGLRALFHASNLDWSSVSQYCKVISLQLK